MLTDFKTMCENLTSCYFKNLNKMATTLIFHHKMIKFKDLIWKTWLYFFRDMIHLLNINSLICFQIRYDLVNTDSTSLYLSFIFVYSSDNWGNIFTRLKVRVNFELWVHIKKVHVGCFVSRFSKTIFTFLLVLCF